MDVKNTFLIGDIEEEFNMASPFGLEGTFKSKVCMLEKSLYGLKKSSRSWFVKFTQYMKKKGYIKGHAKYTLLTKLSRHGKNIALIVYVDDIVLTRDDIDEITKVK